MLVNAMLKVTIVSMQTNFWPINNRFCYIRRFLLKILFHPTKVRVGLSASDFYSNYLMLSRPGRVLTRNKEHYCYYSREPELYKTIL